MFTMDDMLAVAKPHHDKIIAEGKVEQLQKINAAMLAALNECEDFLDDLADVIDGDGKPIPNRAMSLLTEVREAIAKAERAR